MTEDTLQFKPDRIRVQLFKKYTIDYTDLYGRKQSMTKTVSLSKTETVLYGDHNLDRWTELKQKIFPTSKDQAYAENFTLQVPIKAFDRAVINAIETLLTAIQENKYLAGQAAEDVRHILEGMGGKFEYSEYAAEEKRQEESQRIAEAAAKEKAKGDTVRK